MVAAALPRALIANRGWGVVAAPAPVCPRPLLGVQTQNLLPSVAAGLRTSLSSHQVQGTLLMPCPAPRDSLFMLEARMALPGRSWEPSLPQPANFRGGTNTKLWVGKTSLVLEGSTKQQ